MPSESGLKPEILAAIDVLAPDAYAVSIWREVQRVRPRVRESTVRTVLAALERDGVVDSWFSAPRPVRGGKRRRMYVLTKDGEAALPERSVMIVRRGGNDER